MSVAVLRQWSELANGHFEAVLPATRSPDRWRDAHSQPIAPAVPQAEFKRNELSLMSKSMYSV